MYKDQVRAVVLQAEAKQYEFFCWFHQNCDEYSLPKVERYYVLNRIGIDCDFYDDWLDEGDWE